MDFHSFRNPHRRFGECEEVYVRAEIDISGVGEGGDEFVVADSPQGVAGCVG